MRKYISSTSEKRVLALELLIAQRAELLRITPQTSPDYKPLKNRQEENLLEYIERTGREYGK